MALIVLCSIYISIFDLRHHRIANFSIVIISVLLFFEGDLQIYFLSGILFLAPVLLLGMFGGLGGGDVKLLVAVALVAIPVEAISAFLVFLLLAISILTALTIAVRRRLRGNIALAPAICASYLALSLSQ
jgi:Flp pilus assembly protein protease CpaA